jgi:type II secretory ATPase GspE/PulE/Tfp pilus assembly ATPase PilB-like protein
VPVPETHRHLFGENQPDTLFHGAGCAECRGIGYKGRTGIFELLTLNAEVRRLVNARASEDEITAAARANGLCTLREQAIDAVRHGMTTIEEITRVFHELDPRRCEQ